MLHIANSKLMLPVYVIANLNKLFDVALLSLWICRYPSILRIRYLCQCLRVSLEGSCSLAILGIAFGRWGDGVASEASPLVQFPSLALPCLNFTSQYPLMFTWVSHPEDTWWTFGYLGILLLDCRGRCLFHLPLLRFHLFSFLLL